MLLKLLGWSLASLILVYMVYDLVFSDYGYLVFRQEQQAFEALQLEVQSLREQRELLAKEVLRLRNDPDALEELAHRELGYVHKDEFMLIMPADK
ncbi:MAG: septum formation initiator family protein [Mariprofundaceae bacterium]